MERALIEARKADAQVVQVQVELFGSARILSGMRRIEIAVPEISETGDLVSALADECPELLGRVLLEDLSGLKESHTFNLNGEHFLGQGEVRLSPGDSLLLFSSQAGG